MMQSIKHSLSKADNNRLTELVAIVDRNADGFFETGIALNEINRKELWRGTHKSFGALCGDRWGFGVRQAERLIASTAVVNRIVDKKRPIGRQPSVLPTAESQTRELAKVPETEQAEVWEKVLEVTDAPTAKIVKAVVKQWKKLKESISPKPPKLDTVPKPKPSKEKVFKADAPMPEWYADDNGVAVPEELYPVWRAKNRYSMLSQEVPSNELCEALLTLGNDLTHHCTIGFAIDLKLRIYAMCAEIRESVSNLEPSVVIDGKWYSKSEVLDEIRA